MSIQSTRHISRNAAICRIKEVTEIIASKDYAALEKIVFEPNENLQHFVDSSTDDYSNIDKWTNTMLEAKLDMPFFRSSMFDNYMVY